MSKFTTSTLCAGTLLLALILNGCLGSQSSKIDREALIAFYNATDGPNWRIRTNWLSGAPIGEWKGVTVDAEDRVTKLDLTYNDLSGKIPPELGNLSSLELLELNGNRLSGEIPPELGNLSNLAVLTLMDNHLTGCVPEGLRYAVRDYIDELALPFCSS